MHNIIPFSTHTILNRHVVFKYDQRFFSYLYTKLDEYIVVNPIVESEILLMAGLFDSELSLKIMQLKENWNYHRKNDLLICNIENKRNPNTSFYILKYEDVTKILKLHLQYRFSYNSSINFNAYNREDFKVNDEVSEWFSVKDKDHDNLIIWWRLFSEAPYWNNSRVEYRLNPKFPQPEEAKEYLN